MDYAASGVNIDAGNEAVDRIKPLVKKTFKKNVLQTLGSFAAFYELPKGYEKPVMVSCTDGVGTKLTLAIEYDTLSDIGIDLVAMCVNDLICCGAKPLFFLDYIACHSLIPTQMEQLLQGMVEGCLQADCSLVGGEMAEMNDVYKKGEFDLAGFSVGVVEKSKIIDGSKIQPGHNVYGFKSSGVHSNGFSLVRKVLTSEVCKAHNVSKDELLAPTKIYVSLVQQLLVHYNVTGIAHITGGGLFENVTRILPESIQISFNKEAIEVPNIFKTIQTVGQIQEAEMWRVFNMGVGLVVITPDIISHPDATLIGKTYQGPKGAIWSA